MPLLRLTSFYALEFLLHVAIQPINFPFMNMCEMVYYL